LQENILHLSDVDYDVYNIMIVVSPINAKSRTHFPYVIR